MSLSSPSVRLISPIVEPGQHPELAPLLLRQQVERVESRGVDAEDGINNLDSDWLMDG